MSLRAAQAGRAADVHTTQAQLANTGRCLVLVERDVAHAEELLMEARSLDPHVAGRTAFEMVLGMGLLHAFKGEDDDAIPLLVSAAECAAAESHHWEHSLALVRLAKLSLEASRLDEAFARCVELEPLVAKLSEGSEGLFVAALSALARLKLGEDSRTAVAEALGRLRTVDSKAQLAYALDVLAEHEAATGNRNDARRLAEEALLAAEAVGQKSEAAVARSILAQMALDGGDENTARALLTPSTADLAVPLALSARARTAIVRTAARVGLELD
jgi:hypothetical protein